MTRYENHPPQRHHDDLSVDDLSVRARAREFCRFIPYA